MHCSESAKREKAVWYNQSEGKHCECYSIISNVNKLQCKMNHFQRLNEVKELKIFFFAQRANTRKQASSRRLLPCDALAPTAQNRANARYVNDTSAHRRPAAI